MEKLREELVTQHRKADEMINAPHNPQDSILPTDQSLRLQPPHRSIPQEGIEMGKPREEPVTQHRKADGRVNAPHNPQGIMG